VRRLTSLALATIVSCGSVIAVGPGRLHGSIDDCCRTGDEVGGTLTHDAISTWAAGIAGGGVRRPGGASGPPCSRWAPATGINPVSPTDVSSFRVDPDGVTAELYFRDCGTVRQLVWVRRETARSLSRLALSDLRSTALVVPAVTMSPPDRGIVNLETWLAVTDPGAISVTAAIPDLSVTATARVESTTWDMGNGDLVVCEGVGAPWTTGTDADEPAPCGYTYTSAPTAPLRVTATLTWRASWVASNGATGDLGTVTSAITELTYPVVEIVTVGERG
jgi:hypothetical protein